MASHHTIQRYRDARLFLDLDMHTYSDAGGVTRTIRERTVTVQAKDHTYTRSWAHRWNNHNPSRCVFEIKNSSCLDYLRDGPQ